MPRRALLVNGEVSFGSMIRALRLGWGYVAQWHAFLKIQDDAPGRYRVRLRPAHDVPDGHPRKDLYRVWWTDGRAVIDGIAALRGLRRVKRPFEVVIDDEGRIVK